MKENRLCLKRMEEAMSIIDPVFLNTPQFLSETLSRKLGCRIVVKVRTVNPIRSFKGRGAEYFMSSLREKRRILCASVAS